MADFPRTNVGGISLPRLICGSNWVLGFSHTTKAQDMFIRDLFDTPQKVADVVEVFARAGCNAFISLPSDFVAEALREVEQRTGVEMLWVATPSYMEWGVPETWPQSVEQTKKLGAQFCFPHESVTDLLLDRSQRRLDPRLVEHLRLAKEAGLVPGLSTHAPDSIVCADACECDVEAYIQPYNAAGFLCQVETDWHQRLIKGAKKPVLVIKPLAAGRLHPLTGLRFVWSTIRDCDMVAVGTMSTYEAEEVIEISRSLLDGREPNMDLQFTRSKRSLASDGSAV